MSELESLHEASGKVRELYSFGDQMLLVASDRISAFDVIMPSDIPDKGRVLTGLSKFWFDRTTGIVPNHLVSIESRDFPAPARGPELAGRTMLVRRLAMLPLECVVRGYLAGSGWKDYQATGAICGHVLPSGLRESERLPRPIFTPATKAAEGHDINIDRDTAAILIGADRYDELERISIDLYEAAAEYALERGIIIADTKFEFGLDPDGGTVVLGDEALTPDSSRFWPVDGYEPGRPQASFDKQYLRDWLEPLDWDKTPPGPQLPDEVIEGTRSRYAEAYQRLTGEPFSAYLQRMGA